MKAREECGTWWDDPDGGPDDEGPHCCMKTAPHKGSHVCCCSDRRAKNQESQP